MRIKNTSQYPDDEVRKLVTFAMRGIDTTGVLVKVKNSRSAYRGMAYGNVPSMSPARKMKSVDRLITIGIGSPHQFPQDNMVTTIRWGAKVTVGDDGTFPPAPEGYDTRTWRVTAYYEGGRQFPVAMKYGEPIRHPYGGKRSPLIIVNDWREALVAVAAHEARHHYQMKHGKTTSEVDAEKHAAKVLSRFRAA